MISGARPGDPLVAGFGGVAGVPVQNAAQWCQFVVFRATPGASGQVPREGRALVPVEGSENASGDLALPSGARTLHLAPLSRPRPALDQ
jgi:hypothetical protein